MAPHFEVIGDGDYDDESAGSVLGSVMGYAGPMGDYEGLDGLDEEDEADGVVGYDEYGEPVIVGRRGRRRRRRGRRRLVRVAKPTWRARQLAPGVIAPDQGLLPLPLSADNSGTFDLTHQNLTFEGQIQKPFRGERLLVETVRTGTSAIGRIISQLFVGTDLQQLDVPGFDAEAVGNPGAFGVRLTMKPAQPGVFIRLVCTLSQAITSTDTIFASMTILGRNVH
jgi:hypothetical protein